MQEPNSDLVRSWAFVWPNHRNHPSPPIYAVIGLFLFFISIKIGGGTCAARLGGCGRETGVRRCVTTSVNRGTGMQQQSAKSLPFSPFLLCNSTFPPTWRLTGLRTGHHPPPNTRLRRNRARLLRRRRRITISNEFRQSESCSPVVSPAPTDPAAMKLKNQEA
jgi:hypothetical protein